MIFKTLSSDIDIISSKWGIFGRSFNDIGTAIIGRITDISTALQGKYDLVGSIKGSDSILKRLYPSKESIKDKLMDVNSLIPEIDKDNFNFDYWINQLNSIDKKVKMGTSSWLDYSNSLKKNERWIAKWGQETEGQIRTQDDLIKANQQARASALAHNEALKSQTLSAKAQSTALKGLSFALNALASIGLSIIASKVLSCIYDMFTANERLLNSAKKLGSAFQQEQSSIEDYKDQITALQSTINDSSSSFDEVSEARKNLMAVQDELINKFGTEKETIETITGAINGQSDALNLLTKRQYQQWKNSFNKKSFGEVAVDFLFGDNIEAAFDRLISLDFAGAWENLTRPGPSKISQMVSSMQYAHYVLKKSGNDALDSLIAKTYGLQSSGSSFTLYGNLNDIYEDLLGIQELADHFKVSDAFEADAERIANAMYKTLESYKEAYDIYVLYEKILNDSGNNPYDEQFALINRAKEAYNNAVISGDQAEIQKTSHLYAQTLQSALDLAISNGDTAVADYFKSMYPEMQQVFGEWLFQIRFAANTDGIKDRVSGALDSIDGVSDGTITFSVEDIENFSPNTATQEQLDAYGELTSAAESYGLTITQLTALLQTLGLVQSESYHQLVDTFGQSQVDTLSPEDLRIAYTVENAGNLTFEELRAEIQKIKEIESEPKTLFSQLTASSASLDTFQSSIQSAYNAYAALLSGDYSASELLDSIQTLTKTAADMGETIDWEAIADEDQSLRALQGEIDRISQTYAESILNGMDLEPDSGLGKLLARIISEAHTAETAVTDMNTQLDRLISSCQTLTDFLASYNETGAVSLEQLRSLLTADQNLIAMLEVENGQLALNEEAYEQLIEAQLIELKEKLDNAAAAEIEALAKKEAEQATRDHAEASRSAAVLLDEETAAFGRNTSAAIADAVAKAEDAGVTQQEMQSVFDKYTNIWNAAINTYKSNFSAFLGISRSASHTASDNAKAAAEEAKRAAEEAARSAEEALDGFLSRQEAALNAGRISFQEYSDTVSSYLQAAFASGSLSAQKYWSAMQSFLTVKKDSYDAVVSAVTGRIDREINTLKDRQDSIAAGYQSQIDSLEKQKELLQGANEERKRQLDLQKALYDQERAHQQRTILQYSEDRGMHYIQDAQALRDAKTQVEDARLQIKTAEIEQAVTDLEEARDREKASLDGMILSLEHYRDQWSQISTAYEEAQENQLAAMILGQNWEADILGMRTDVLAAFTDNYIRLQQQIADAAWESANAQIAAQKEAAKGTDGTKGAAQALSKKPSADGAAPKAPSSFDAPAALSAPKRKLTISSGGGNTQKLVFARPGHTLLSFHTGLKQGPVDSHSFDDDFRLVQQVGLKANEVPAILKEGEAVATQAQIRNLAEGLRHTEGKAPADQAALTEETIITRDGLILTPIQPGDEMYELMQKYNTYLESIDGNLEKMLPPAVYEQGKQMADAVSRAANSSVVNNQNMQPVSIGDIHITCPGITSQEVARQVGDQLNQMFRGLHLDAIQRSTMR